VRKRHRDDGKRFVVRADEKLTAFVELESAIRGRKGKRYTSQRTHLISGRVKIAGRDSAGNLARFNKR
jgi:hypothetical protein